MGLKSKIKNIIHTVIFWLKEEKSIPIPVPTEENEKLKGKVALITGGSGGIGLSMAKEFVRCGAKVIIAGTNEEKLKKILNDVHMESKLKYIVLDVTDTHLLGEKVNEAASLFAENRIDILVNSAGLVSHSDFMNMSENEYDSIMNVNAKGTFFMSQAVGKHMIENGIKGHILNVTSSSALRPAWTPYQMSKWAVRGLTLGMADVFLPYGIIVNAIAPGPTATPMLGKDDGDTIGNPITPAGRYSMPSEIAALAAFMVSDYGNMIIGDTFYITGGSGTISLHK